MDRLGELHEAGVSIWLDTLSRDLLDSGEFARLVSDCHVTGATSNPTIFAKAITTSDLYGPQLVRLLTAGERDTGELFLTLALEDVRRAADILEPVHQRSDGTDGFVSFECTPDLADDTDGTIAQARDLWDRLQRQNVMIKVPATAAGIPAIRTLTSDGINVNVTLLFSVARYLQVLDAYQTGLEARLRADQPIDHIASVASFFVSRVDTKVDERLPGHSPLRGQAAVANAAAAYREFLRTSAADRWQKLAAAGAGIQRPLWASTGTKNDAYSDVLYVEHLIAPGTVNTMPQATLDAFADHGTTHPTLQDSDPDDLLEKLARADIDLDRITADLEREGVESFNESYRQLLACITERVAELDPASTHTKRSSG